MPFLFCPSCFIFFPMLSRLLFLLLGALFPACLWLCYLYHLPLWWAGFLLLPMIFKKRALLGWTFGILIALMGGISILMREGGLLKFYPVMMSALFLCLFGFSLLKPPTIIERLARKMMPDFPDEAVSYTTKVTIAWCLFFIINGSIAIWTTKQNMNIWVLWNGCLAYIAMGALFLVEYLIRRRVIARAREKGLM
jgi:uncharacterized membrane protein